MTQSVAEEIATAVIQAVRARNAEEFWKIVEESPRAKKDWEGMTREEVKTITVGGVKVNSPTELAVRVIMQAEFQSVPPLNLRWTIKKVDGKWRVTKWERAR